MKKTKDTNTLYDFNVDEKKNNKKVNNKKVKNNKKAKKTNIKENKSDNKKNKIDLNNEIIIGLSMLDDKEDNDKKSKKTNTKKSNKNKEKKIKKDNKDKKNKKDKSKKEDKIKNKKIKNNKKSNRKQITNNSINQQDIIFETRTEEVKQPKKKTKIFKYIFLTICVIGLIVAAMMSPLFDIKEINIEGNEKLTNEEILSLSQMNIGENTFRTSTIKAKNNIMENAYVESVDIKRVLPDKILISVTERKATYMIEYGSGFVYINNQGYILEISEEKLEVPILQGAETSTEEFKVGNRICANDLEKMTTVIKIMEIAQNNDISNLITRIDIENKQNYKIIFEGEQKVAYIGDNTDLNTKILCVKSIVDREKGISGEIFVNMDLKTGYPTFRQSV